MYLQYLRSSSLKGEGGGKVEIEFVHVVFPNIPGTICANNCFIESDPPLNRELYSLNLRMQPNI